MPFTCEACGRSPFPDLLPADGDVLRCPHCGDARAFVRPPLLVVTGTAGVGKSTLCARLAGTIAGTVLLDVDVFAEDFVSVLPPDPDYPAFWRSMMRLAHEVAQNNLALVYFSTMMPEQVLSNTDCLGYFGFVRFLFLACPPDVLRTRLARRDSDATAARVDFWVDFNRMLADAADRAAATVVDASRAIDQIEDDVRRWIESELKRGRPVSR